MKQTGTNTNHLNMQQNNTSTTYLCDILTNVIINSSSTVAYTTVDDNMIKMMTQTVAESFVTFSRI